MAKTANISFADGDGEIYDWMEEMHNEGPFRNRSHVVVEALRRMKEDDKRDVLI